MSYVSRGSRDRDRVKMRPWSPTFQVPSFEFPVSSSTALGSHVCTVADRTLLSLVIMI